MGFKDIALDEMAAELEATVKEIMSKLCQGLL